MTDSIGAILSAIITVAVYAFIAGAIFAIGLQTGISPDEAGISLFAVKTVCEAFEDDDSSGTVKYNCAIIIPFMVILSIILAVVAAFEHAALVGDWRIGISIYIIFWIIGLIYII